MPPTGEELGARRLIHELVDVGQRLHQATGDGVERDYLQRLARLPKEGNLLVAEGTLGTFAQRV